jgi:hypothetical protein
MNCEVAHERIVLGAYGELTDEQAHELERHLATCPRCSHERQQVLALQSLAAAHSVAEPDANLVARSRLRLEVALDAVPPKRWYERLALGIVKNVSSLQSAPAAAILLLIIGGGAGTLAGYEFAQGRLAHVAGRQQVAQLQKAQSQPADSAPAEIANISSIARQPNSEIIEVRYNQIVPQRIEGSLDDPTIRQLLILASENASSAGVRDDSVGLLAAECRTGHGCKGEGFRDVLMTALRYDKNEGVRAKALEGLEPYVSEDMRVRDAVLEAVLYDSAPRIRTAAINILEPVEADTSVRQVLSTVANSDHNPHIRNASREILSRAPVIQ